MLRRNVLIFQMGGLGDFILTWPLAVALGRIYPQSRIIYVTHKQKGDLARRVLRLEATDAEAGWHGLFADRGTLPPTTQSLLESAHAIYTFLPVTPTWHQNVERLNLLARRVEIDTHLVAGFTGHLTDRMLECLRNYPPERAALQQMLRSIADRGIGFKPTGGDDIVIHPGAGSLTKRWSLDRYVQLAAQINKPVRFVMGEVEREKFSAEDRQKLASAGTVRECNTALDLLNEISTAAAFIGNDSGPSHLAGIIGVPTIALFGPTDPVNWKPLGPRVQDLRHQPIANLSVSDVQKAIETMLVAAPVKTVKNENADED